MSHCYRCEVSGKSQVRPGWCRFFGLNPKNETVSDGTLCRKGNCEWQRHDTGRSFGNGQCNVLGGAKTLWHSPKNCTSRAGRITTLFVVAPVHLLADDREIGSRLLQRVGPPREPERAHLVSHTCSRWTTVNCPHILAAEHRSTQSRRVSRSHDHRLLSIHRRPSSRSTSTAEPRFLPCKSNTTHTLA